MWSKRSRMWRQLLLSCWNGGRGAEHDPFSSIQIKEQEFRAGAIPDGTSVSVSRLVSCHWWAVRGEIFHWTQNQAMLSQTRAFRSLPRSPFLPDAVPAMSSWKCGMQWESSSSPGFSGWLGQWFAGCPWKSQLSFAALDFSVVQSRAVLKHN